MPLGRVLVLGTLIVCLAGCGGTAKAPSVASLGTTTSSNSSGHSVVPNGGSFLKFVNCMRAHGIQAQLGVDGRGVSISSEGVGPNAPHFRKAQVTCQKFLPGGGPKPLTSAQQEAQLKRLLTLAKCMRAHGVSNFPDPTANGFAFDKSSLQPGSPQFQAAAKACGASNGKGGFAIRLGP